MNEITNDNPLRNVFRKVQPGKCRLALNGKIAIETSGGYKTFSSKTKTLTNCSNFVTDIGDELFYVIPTAKVRPGDIILIGGLPRCVISTESNMVTVMTYETGCIEQILPERQMFMGSIFFFSKIVSPTLGMFGSKNKMNGMLKMMMLSDLGRGNTRGESKTGLSGVGDIMQLMILQGIMKDTDGSFEDIFGDLAETETDEADEDMLA